MPERVSKDARAHAAAPDRRCSRCLRGWDRRLALQHQAIEEPSLVHVVIGVGLVHDAAVVPQHHVAVMPLVSVLGAAQAGKIKLLAVTNAKRTPAAQNVPTVTESGYPEFTFGGFLGLFGPKDMSGELRERIASDMRDVLKEEDIKQRLADVGLLARGTTPAEFETVMTAQRVKWSAIAREHNIEPQ